MSAAMDVVYPVKLANSDQEGEELRHSLRSLVNLPHKRVWIVGDLPVWARNVHHIPVIQNQRKFVQLCANIREACLNPEITDHFVIFNADFFVVRPVDEVRPAWRETIAEAIARYQRQSMPEWGRHMQQIQRRFKTGLNYELHIPMVVGKQHMLDALDSGIGVGPCWRTAYGNIARIGGERRTDVKVNRSRGQPDLVSEFCSSSDRAWALGPCGQWIRNLFPDKSEYEV